MSEARFVTIETKFAHQEYTIEQLNQQVCHQQQRIDDLEHKMAITIERVKALTESQPANAMTHEKPPHY